MTPPRIIRYKGRAPYKIPESILQAPAIVELTEPAQPEPLLPFRVGLHAHFPTRREAEVYSCISAMGIFEWRDGAWHPDPAVNAQEPLEPDPDMGYRYRFYNTVTYTWERADMVYEVNLMACAAAELSQSPIVIQHRWSTNDPWLAITTINPKPRPFWKRIFLNRAVILASCILFWAAVGVGFWVLFR
ncbi:hypothetical protein ABIB89_003307 [Bradyrhizobium sp. JR3.12]